MNTKINFKINNLLKNKKKFNKFNSNFFCNFANYNKLIKDGEQVHRNRIQIDSLSLRQGRPFTGVHSLHEDKAIHGKANSRPAGGDRNFKAKRDISFRKIISSGRDAAAHGG